MPLDLDEQLRAFGATLQHVVAEPITPPTAEVLSLDAHRDDRRRRWVAVAGAAACVAVAAVGLVWLAGSGPADIGVSSTPSIGSSPVTTLPSTTASPASTTDPVATGDTIEAPAPVAPAIDGRSVQFPDCPRLVLLIAPPLPGTPEWASSFVADRDAAVLAAPSGDLRVSVTDLGNGQFRDVDGYPATTPTGSRVVRIHTGRLGCPSIEIDYGELDAADEATLFASLDLDDRDLTDAAAQIDGTSLFDRHLFERVTADPFVEIVSAAYGPPDADTGWLPVPADFAAICGQNDEYRSIFWQDLRVVFERRGTVEELTAWSIGDQRTGMLAPTDTHQPSGALGLTAADGVQVGADVSVLDQFPMVGDNGDGTYTIAATVARSVSTVDSIITGIGQGRNDCA